MPLNWANIHLTILSFNDQVSNMRVEKMLQTQKSFFPATLTILWLQNWSRNPWMKTRIGFTFKNILENSPKEHMISKRKKKVNCRSQLAVFYHEMGNPRQSVLGFLQLTSDSDRLFMINLAKGNLGYIRTNSEVLQQLQTICPVLHGVYSTLRDDVEEHLFNKVVKRLYNLYVETFRDGPQWWEDEQDVTSLPHEQYIVSGRPKLRDLPNYLTSYDSQCCKKVPYSTSNFTGTFFLACEHGFYIAALLMQVIID